MVVLLRVADLLLYPLRFMRIITLLALLSTGAALLVARQERLTPGAREPVGWPPAVVCGYPAVPTDHDPRLFDPKTGQCERLTLGDGERIAAASCSPWRDEQGRFHLVGRWTTSTGQGTERVLADVGVIRCAFPGGAVLDRVATDVIPVAPPCWYPGTSARILFGATDGQLYELDFERPSAAGSALHRPRPLKWSEDLRETPDVYVLDVTWPTDARFGNYVLAAFSRRIPGASALSPAQIWWLELDPTGTVIERASRLTQHEPGGSSDLAERRPVLATRADGSLQLAYLVNRAGHAGWRVRIATVTLNRQTGAPCAERGLEATGAPASLAMAPVFAVNGESLFALFPAGGDRLRIKAIPLPYPLRPSLSGDRSAAAMAPIWCADGPTD